MNSYSKISTDKNKQEKILKKIEDDSLAEKIPIIDRQVGYFLSSLVFSIRPSSILEIGCGIGYSTYFLLLNSLDASYIGIDLNKKRLERAESFIRGFFKDKKVDFIPGNALKLVADMKEKFELVFIDGAKFEYPYYIKAVLKNLAKGALVISDNVFYNGKVFSDTVSSHDKNSVAGLREYIDILESDKRFKNIYVDLADGLSISIYEES